jgi:hypothetical protein
MSSVLMRPVLMRPVLMRPVLMPSAPRSSLGADAEVTDPGRGRAACGLVRFRHPGHLPLTAPADPRGTGRQVFVAEVFGFEF